MIGLKRNIVLFVLSVLLANSAISGTLKITGGPYLQQAADDGMTIVWRTNRPCVSRVEYGPGFGRSAVASRHGLIDADTTLHRIRIDGLATGATCDYRIASTEITLFKPYEVVYGETVTTGPFQFTTLDPGKTAYSFVVLNDRHEKIPAFERALGSIDWRGVDLVILNGDMLNHAESEDQVFASVVDPCVAAFARAVPFVYVRGNHEARGRFARRLLDYFPSEGDRYYYSFDHGPVHFIVLDAGEDKEDANKEYFGLVDFDRYRAEQTEWLRRDLASEAAQVGQVGNLPGQVSNPPHFRVVLVHIPLDGAQGHGSTDAREQWLALLDEAGTDLMLAGHIHRYVRTMHETENGGYPIVTGSIDTVIRVNVTNEQLEAIVLKDDGTKADEQSVFVPTRTSRQLEGAVK